MIDSIPVRIILALFAIANLIPLVIVSINLGANAMRLRHDHKDEVALKTNAMCVTMWLIHVFLGVSLISLLGAV